MPTYSKEDFEMNLENETKKYVYEQASAVIVSLAAEDILTVSDGDDGLGINLPLDRL